MRTEQEIRDTLERWGIAKDGYVTEFEDTKHSGRETRLDYLQERIEECEHYMDALEWVLGDKEW
jgi:hypothetical protein